MSKSKKNYLIVFLKSGKQPDKMFQNQNAFNEYLSNISLRKILMNAI